MGSFRFLDEIAIADCAVEVTGTTLGDVFETSARALAEVTADPGTVPLVVERRVVLEEPTLDLLLFEWISELVYRKDESGEVYPRTRVEVSGDGPFRLDARLEGGPLVHGATGLRADVKGVTLHRFVLESREEGWHASFVLDL
jgi:SHS2 domain-containing protein